MYSRYENKMVPISEELAAKFADPEAQLTPMEREQREWTRFAEGETVNVKGINFHVHEIGESRLILKPLDKTSWQK